MGLINPVESRDEIGFLKDQVSQFFGFDMLTS